MSQLYGPRQRALQDRFDTRRVADAVEAIALRTEFGELEKGFIESRDMFWLSSVNEDGWPTVSYKGGDPGFVRVLDANTLAFPSYDGNGMFYSLGNIAGNARVGLLFLDLERPHRIRVQGRAAVSDDAALLATFPEAQLVVTVTVTQLWQNCPRYVHRYQKVQASKYVPRAGCPTPLAGWKRIDALQEALPASDQGRAAREGGTIAPEAWFEQVFSGHPDA